MHRSFPIFLLATLFANCLGCGGGAEHVQLTWTEYRDPAGAFSVLMPAAVHATEATNASPVGETVSASHVASVGPANFSIIYEEFPQQYVQEIGGGLLEAAMKSNRRSGAILLSQSPTTLAGHPAMEYEVQEQTDQRRVLKGRLMLLNNRLYDVFVDAPSGVVAADDAVKFLNSFQIPAQ